MSILDSFRDWQDVPCAVSRKSATIVNGRPVFAESSIGSFFTIFYLAGQSQGVYAEKIRENVDAIVIFDPEVDVLPQDELLIDGVKYNAVYVDNVAYRGEAKVVQVGLIS